MKVLFFLSAVAACILAAEKEPCFNSTAKYEGVQFGYVAYRYGLDDNGTMLEDFYAAVLKGNYANFQQTDAFITTVALPGKQAVLRELTKPCSNDTHWPGYQSCLDKQWREVCKENMPTAAEIAAYKSG